MVAHTFLGLVFNLPLWRWEATKVVTITVGSAFVFVLAPVVVELGQLASVGGAEKAGTTIASAMEYQAEPSSRRARNRKDPICNSPCLHYVGSTEMCKATPSHAAAYRTTPSRELMSKVGDEGFRCRGRLVFLHP